ncbi:MAG: helix-turn-helix domain-containing protein [Candidatus Aenigmatarchaeota archaeon]
MEKEKKEDIRRLIIELLRKHPEGLTIQQISNELGFSRITVAKYLHELLGAEIIYQRKVGKAKLCYLKQFFAQKITDEEILEELRKRLGK